MTLWCKLLILKEILNRRRRIADRRRGAGDPCHVATDRRMGPDRRNGLRSLGFSLLCLGLGAPASAQIYSWTDGNGRLVLSDRPQPGSPARSYTVPRAENVRATRYVSSSRINVYDDVILEHAKLNNVRPDLVRAVIQVESAFNPYARSPKGALGLMQLMPATARELGVANPFNVVENVRGGVVYLRRLLDRYGNNEQLALAAYNAGPGAVDKYGETVPPYRETQNYVSRIKQIAGPAVRVPGTKIYKITEIVDGRESVTYTDKAPSAAR
jgi:soluble lytic murein transglycosylase-like protein